ncbi:hypothetical protein ACFFQW_23290 [Umezawaea endophytica]|uniref:Uncharacterized protein n=1 Tax=Umezawaea endophytica TaxID=1654476 RepID=A0A9X2VR73_9PSEU|nr:hypothetical protein [Umezawaea endophytica]MCS7481371.1 hypothetical protein [Umezawaea endophytica]
MGVVVGKRVVAALGVAAVLLVGGGGPARADAEDDAKAVFCLTVKSERNLRDAGKAVGVEVPSDVPAWRAAKPAEFERVCSALYGSEKAPSPDWFTQALPFLTGLFGALLAYVATAWRDRVARGRKQGEDLRGALVEFENAVAAYLSAYVGGKPEGPVLTSRAKLVSQLALVKSEHRGWSRVQALLDGLREGPLGESLTQPAGQGDAARARGAQLRVRLDELRDEVLLVATALTRPARRHPEMSPRSR